MGIHEHTLSDQRWPPIGRLRARRCCVRPASGAPHRACANASACMPCARYSESAWSGASATAFAALLGWLPSRPLPSVQREGYRPPTPACTSGRTTTATFARALPLPGCTAQAPPRLHAGRGRAAHLATARDALAALHVGGHGLALARPQRAAVAAGRCVRVAARRRGAHQHVVLLGRQPRLAARDTASG